MKSHCSIFLKNTQEILGTGFPVASQKRTTFSPSSTIRWASEGVTNHVGGMMEANWNEK